MKFSIAALSLGLTATATNAVRLTGQKMGLTRQLLENAQYHSGAAPRDLEENAFEITGLHSVIFKACETLSVQPNFNENGDDNYQIQSLYEKGAIKAQKSFVLFDVCQSDLCYDSSSKTTYITDLGSFIQAFAEFIPSKQEQYCEGCQENYNYCQYKANNSGNATVDGYASMYGNNNNNNNARNLQQDRVIEYIDCDRCSAFSCFSNANANGENNNGNNNANQNQAAYSLEWIQSMANCEGNNQNGNGEGYYFQGTAVTTGFMCNEDGDGVEIAAFLDDQCSLYTNQVAYGNLMNSYDYTYWSNSREIIQYMFTTEFSCYNPEMMFINPYDEQLGTYGENNADENNNNGEYQDPQAAEWCQAVFQSEMQVSPCGGNMTQYNNNNNGQQQDENGNYQDTYSSYGYLSEDDVNNGYTVCQALQGNGGQGEHLYDKKNSGSMYQYSGQKKGSKDAYGNQKIASKGGNAGLITFFVIAFVVAGAAGVALFLKKKQLFKQDDKKEPLVTDEKGEMA